MARKKTPAQMLGEVGLFEGLSNKELKQIYQASREVVFPQGSIIVKEGEEGVGFHLIVAGKAKVTLKGRARTMLGPGKFFGELSLIDRGPRTATVTAETDVTTLSLVSWEFLPLVEKTPSIARKLLLEMCRRLREADKSHTH
jgi:CRP/FNR family transcriptional regulator, cyclic AMP receptor protein